MADRFCGNCGDELRPSDKFCPNCGRPVHEAARVPTPEADVPVPPLPSSRQVGDIPAPPGGRSTDTDPPKEWWQSRAGWAVVAYVAVASLLYGAAAIFPRLTVVAAVIIFVGLLVVLAYVLYRVFVLAREGPPKVVSSDHQEPIAEAERSRYLEEAVGKYVRRGFFVQLKTPTTAQLVRPKKFSFLWALLWFLVFGVGLVVYLIYYAALRDERVYLAADEFGNVRATGQVRTYL